MKIKNQNKKNEEIKKNKTFFFRTKIYTTKFQKLRILKSETKEREFSSAVFPCSET